MAAHGRGRRAEPLASGTRRRSLADRRPIHVVQDDVEHVVATPCPHDVSLRSVGPVTGNGMVGRDPRWRNAPSVCATASDGLLSVAGRTVDACVQ